jgi:hypothetical protein
MNSVKVLEQVDLVKQGLNDMGLGHFPVGVIDSGDRNNNLAIAVTYGTGVFGKHIETLDKYWSLKLFMMFFEGRKNYLALPEEERAAITMHPQQWEREFLANNVTSIEL